MSTCSVLVSLDSTGSWINNNTHKTKRSCTQRGKLQTGLGEILKPSGTEPPAQEGAERRQIQQARGKSEFSVPTAEAPLQECSSQVMSLLWDAQQGGTGVFLLFQIQLYVSDQPWNAHTELQKIKVCQHHTEWSALSCSPKEGSATAAPFLMDGYLTLNTSNIRDPNTSLPIIFQYFTILAHKKLS